MRIKLSGDSVRPVVTLVSDDDTDGFLLQFLCGLTFKAGGKAGYRDNEIAFGRHSVTLTPVEEKPAVVKGAE